MIFPRTYSTAPSGEHGTSNICILPSLTLLPWIVPLTALRRNILFGTKKELYKDKDKDPFIDLQEFFVGYSKAPEQQQSNARPIC